MFDLKRFIEDQYGERCPDYEPGCACCVAWSVYTTSGRQLASAIERYAKDFATTEVLRALDRQARLM